MSDHLKAFLSAYLEWVESGAPESDVFERFCGLCSNCKWYMRDIGLSESGAEIEVFNLQDLFTSEGLDEDYPFGGQALYEYESGNDDSHLNKARIDWVRSKVEQFAAA